MTEILTYEQFQKLARENYNRGGDSVVECWDRCTFDDYVKEWGPITTADALALFRMYNSVTGDTEGTVF